MLRPQITKGYSYNTCAHSLTNSVQWLPTLLQTPSDDSSFENEVWLFSSVEDFDEHPVHVVSLDSVPEERDEDEVVAENVGDTTAETRAGEMVSNVQYDQKNHQWYTEV